ncbi:MAG: radical SAM protein [Candidatus Omnitrophica bacterium]|nr:radical SAM protein [Candidatus Omnitrophota bacterium]
MNYFYGPVPSRRLGFSLGVDITPKKACVFNCVYCQLGKTTKLTTTRFHYVKFPTFKKELKNILKRKPKIDYITIAGSGEPTLHKGLDTIIALIKAETRNKYPVCVITNSALLDREEVRRELLQADLIIPSLDAATKRTFYKIDRPHRDVRFENIIKGLIALRQEFKGKIWLEIMVLSGYNDTRQEAEAFKKIIKKINPDKVQLNLPVRPTGAKIALPEYKKLLMLKKIIGKKAEIVSGFYKDTQKKFSQSIKQDIIKYLKVRPATLVDLTKATGQNKFYLKKQLKTLIAKKIVKEKNYHHNKYFVSISSKN